MSLPARGRRHRESWGVKEVLLNDTVCSNHHAGEAAKSRELVFGESRLLTGCYGGGGGGWFSKPGELASSESLWG